MASPRAPGIRGRLEWRRRLIAQSWPLLSLRLLPVLALGACASIPGRPARLEPTSYGCMSAVVKQKLPPQLPDKEAHCLAAALIARYCSPTEAYMAGAGKEVRDLFTGGDVEWADWRADREGIRCARQQGSDSGVAECCARSRALEKPRAQ